MPPITLYFLQASRSIRIAWLLEELGLDYAVEFHYREQNKAPRAYRDSCGSALGKAPVLRDGDAVIYESGAIVEYLCAKYDTTHTLIPPPTSPLYIPVLQFLHASEGTLMLHALAITYAHWHSPPTTRQNGDLAKMTDGMAANVIRDFNWLEGQLVNGSYEGAAAEAGRGRFLVGDSVTAADVMMQFSCRFVLERGLGTEGRVWPGVEEWLRVCEGTEGYRRAVERTGFSLENGGNGLGRS